MSTRHLRTADKAANERNTKILKSLLQQPDNKFCADCKKKDPRWASWNIGIFVCIRCSGVHRSMGTHISKVKSVDLDTWLPDQVDNMVKWGNAKAAKYWEANLKDKKPSESNIDGWIRAKYEHKRWAMKGPIPDPNTLGGDDNETTITNSSPQVAKPAEASPVAAKAKPSSDFANLDAFLGSPSTTQRASNSSSPAQQLHGADFFATANEDVIRHSSSAPATPAHSRPDTPSSAEPGTSKHKDLKSSILSLYNTPRSGAASTTNFSPQSAAATAATNYASNIGNYQQQLSGLSLGPPSGMIPQPPTQQANLYQNVWGGFQEGPSQQQQQQQAAWNNDFSGFNQTPSGFQQTMPQGGQFFSMEQNNRPASQSNTPSAPQRPTFDAFADLANFGN